jgi:hypothetical protein
MPEQNQILKSFSYPQLKFCLILQSSEKCKDNVINKFDYRKFTNIFFQTYLIYIGFTERFVFDSTDHLYLNLDFFEFPRFFSRNVSIKSVAYFRTLSFYDERKTSMG